MSNTPRTDAVVFNFCNGHPAMNMNQNVVRADFARELERDYEEAQADKRRLTRELDVIWNGEAGAAKQASLCDIVAQLAKEVPAERKAREGLHCKLSALVGCGSPDAHAELQQVESLIERAEAAERDAARIKNSWSREMRRVAGLLGFPEENSKGSIADWKYICHKLNVPTGDEAAIYAAKEDK